MRPKSVPRLAPGKREAWGSIKGKKAWKKTRGRKEPMNEREKGQKKENKQVNTKRWRNPKGRKD